MGFKESADKFVDNHLRSNHKPVQVDADLYDEIQNALGDGKLLRVRPYPENDGLEAGEELMQALHDLRTEFFGWKNISQTKTFEIWFTDGKIQFMFYVKDRREEQKFRKQIDAYYPNARIEEVDHVFPPIRDGDYVAGSELELKRSKYHPVRSRHGVREFISDPYKSITSDMVSSDKCRIVVQVLFKPALQSWADGGPFGYINPLGHTVDDYAENLRSDQLMEDFFSVEMRSPTQEERQLAEYVSHQRGLPAYHLNLRILAFSPVESEASSNAWSVGKTFEQSFKEVGGQTFTQNPRGGVALKDFVRTTAARQFTDQDMVLTIPEVAAVAHIPNDSIETPSVDWNNLREGDRLPADAERFEETHQDREPPTRDTEHDTDESDQDSVVTTQSTTESSGFLSRLLNRDSNTTDTDSTNADSSQPTHAESENPTADTTENSRFASPDYEHESGTTQADPDSEWGDDSEPLTDNSDDTVADWSVDELDDIPTESTETDHSAESSPGTDETETGDSDSVDDPVSFEDALYETVTVDEEESSADDSGTSAGGMDDSESDPLPESGSDSSVSDSVTSTTDVVKESDEVWTKPDPDDPEYNPAKDNSKYWTGYDEDEMSGDWTGGDARDMDQNGDFESYDIPDTGTESEETDSETDSTSTETDSDGDSEMDPWGDSDADDEVEY